MDNKLKVRYVLIFAMFVAAIFILGIMLLMTGSWKISFAVAGVLLALDLTFIPKVLPQFFKDD